MDELLTGRVIQVQESVKIQSREGLNIFYIDIFRLSYFAEIRSMENSGVKINQVFSLSRRKSWTFFV